MNINRTFRYLLRNKLQTIINIVGLTIGITGALLIFVLVLEMTSVDKFHENGESLYQLKTETPKYVSSTASALLAGMLIEEIPEIKGACRTKSASSDEKRIGFKNESFNFGGIYADPSLFELFTFPFIKGSHHVAKSNYQSIVLSEKMANTLFGNSEVINKVVMLFNSSQYKPEVLTVTGVFKNVPENSTFKFDYVIPFEYYTSQRDWIMSWGRQGTNTYVQLLEGADELVVADKITQIINTKDGTAKDTKMHLLSVEDRLLWQSATARSPLYYVLFMFSFIAASILFIAIFNFINLSTYNNLKRSSEVGIRKVSGAGISTLTKQFILETGVLVIFASCLALLLSHLLLPIMGEAFEAKMYIPFSSPVFILGLIFIIVFTSLVSGWLPSYQMCRINPVRALKGSFNQKKGKSSVRRLLVNFQFGISIFLIICTIIMNKQINYISNESFGLNRDKVVSFISNKQFIEHREAFRSEIESHTEIEGLTFTSSLPIQINFNTSELWWPGKDDDIYMSYLNADIGFVETLGLKLISGTSFKQRAGSKEMILLNRKAAEKTGIENPVGSIFKLGKTEVEVVGIVENFQTNNAVTGLKPLFIRYNPQSTSYGILKLKGGSTAEGIKIAKATFKKFVPDFPFEYSFLDDDFATLNKFMYFSKKISLIAAILAIVLACLGLFGLSISSTELKIKEIGIRKVNGATIRELLILLNKSYIMWIAISFTCVFPLAWLLMNNYLKFFAFKINLSWWVFALAGGLVLGVALLTVSWQSWRAATHNPVEALRYE